MTECEPKARSRTAVSLSWPSFRARATVRDGSGTAGGAVRLHRGGGGHAARDRRAVPGRRDALARDFRAQPGCRRPPRRAYAHRPRPDLARPRAVAASNGGPAAVVRSRAQSRVPKREVTGAGVPLAALQLAAGRCPHRKREQIGIGWRHVEPG